MVATGFTAQERSWGFVGPRGIASLGGLILHEAVHTVEGSGTVGFCSSALHYWKGLFHGGSAEHPHERLAYEVEGRFLGWMRTQGD